MESLGINITNLIIYTALFGIVFLLLKKYLFPSLMKIIEARETEITEVSEKQEKLDEKLSALHLDKEAMMEENRVKLKEEYAEAKKELANERNRIIREAEQEAELIINASKEQLDIDRENMKSEIEARIEAATKRILHNVYSQNKPEFDKKLISSALEELK